MGGWAGRCGLPRLLAILLALALVLPFFVAAADAHDHVGAPIVTAEAPMNTSGGQQDGACLVCHVHCGCHVGLPVREPGAGLTSFPEPASALLVSDQRRPSAQATQLIRPPKL